MIASDYKDEECIVAKTIKQLADELGVSKQTSHYQIKSLPVNKKDQEIVCLHDTLAQTQKLLNQSQQLQLIAEKKLMNF